MSILTTAQLAEELQLSIETVRRMARSGRIPSMQPGRAYRFDLADVKSKLYEKPDPWAQSAQSRGRKRSR